MPLRAVIFDLFHTLTGLESECSKLPRTADVLGISRRVWTDTLITKSRWRLTGEQRDPYTIVRMLANEIDSTISDDRIREATEIRIQRFRDSLKSIPEQNLEALRQIRKAGLQTALISNADVMEVAAWSDSPLCGLFDVEVFSCMAGCVKPEPAIFRNCLDALGLDAEECLFVGDGGSNELEGAKDVGISTVFVSGVIDELWPEHAPHRREISDHQIVWLPEILNVLGLNGRAEIVGPA